MIEFLKRFADNLLLFLKITGGVLLCIFLGFVAYAILYAIFMGFTSLLGTAAGIAVSLVTIMFIIVFGFTLIDLLNKRKNKTQWEK